jgi:hypothetical protein
MRFTTLFVQIATRDVKVKRCFKGCLRLMRHINPAIPARAPESTRRVCKMIKCQGKHGIGNSLQGVWFTLFVPGLYWISSRTDTSTKAIYILQIRIYICTIASRQESLHLLHFPGCGLLRRQQRSHRTDGRASQLVSHRITRNAHINPPGENHQTWGVSRPVVLELDTYKRHTIIWLERQKFLEKLSALRNVQVCHSGQHEAARDQGQQDKPDICCAGKCCRVISIFCFVLTLSRIIFFASCLSGPGKHAQDKRYSGYSIHVNQIPHPLDFPSLRLTSLPPTTPSIVRAGL